MSEYPSLKQLQTLEAETKTRLDRIKNEQRDISRLVNQETENLKEIQEKIHQLTTMNSKVVISEHAILRYFERVLGFNLDDIRDKIVSEKVQTQINHFGGGVFPVDSTDDSPAFKIRVRNNTVVTLLTDE